MNRSISSWQLWRRVFERSAPTGKTGRKTAPRRKRSTRFCLEELETRTLLTGPGAPVANDDFTDTDGNNPVNIAVLSNDSAQAGINQHSVAVVTSPSHGNVFINKSSGGVTYAAIGTFTGTDEFQYNFQDNNGVSSNTATVTVVVNRPKANDDFIDTDAGNAVTIDVLANDTDPDGNNQLDPSTVRVGTAPANGSAAVASNGTITYTPRGNFSGTDTFTYTVKDFAGAQSNPATVTVVVNRPTANDDFAQTSGTAPVVITVLDNDNDPDGPNLLNPATVTVTSGPAHGSASIDHTNGAITYTAQAGFIGTDTFLYTVNDLNNATSNPATVTITVSASGVVNDDSIDTDAGNPVQIDVLANDSAPSGLAASTVAVATQPTHGSITGINLSTGVITYTPVQGFAGTDTFTYTVKNNAGSTLGPATVRVVVNRPTANDDFIDTDAGNPVTIDVLANDTDPDGPNKLNPASVNVVTLPTHGSIRAIDTTTGMITYTPQDGFSGTDTFGYTVTDINGATSNVATVSVIVNRPTANDDSIDTDGTNPVTVDVLANDTDPDGPNKLDATTVTVVTPPTHGSITSIDHTTGKITYQAQAGFAGTDTFQYTVKDVANATSNPATVSVIVNRPTAEDDSAITFGTTPVAINVLANDSDPDGPGKIDPSTVTVVTSASHGTTSIDHTSGLITYTPNSGFSGVDTFTYTVADFPGATSNVATVSVTVNPPTANADSVTTIGTKPVSVNVLANDTDPNGFAAIVPSSVSVTSGPSHGHVNVNAATGQITYTASAGFLGVDHFSYSIADSFGSHSGTALVTVDVTQAARPIVRPQKNHGRPTSHVLILDPATGATEFVLTPFGPHYTGGILVTLADVNGDGVFDFITSAAHGKHTVRVFDGTTGAPLAGPLGNAKPVGQARANGLRTTAGDVNGDGFADVFVGTGPDARPHLTVYSGNGGGVLYSFDVFPGSFRDGIQVRGADINGDGRADILTFTRHNGHGLSEAFDGATGAPLGNLTAAQLDQFFAARL